MTSLLVFDASFYPRADGFAKHHPRYQGKDTIGTRYHVCNAVTACGYSEVTQSNIDEIFAALESRARCKEQDAVKDVK